MAFTDHLKLAMRFATYYVTSTNRHGLQGPFAYRLNDAVFRNDKNEPLFAPVEEVRNALLRDNSTINVRDFGAGFGGVNYKERAISYIARHSAKPPRYARMLHRLVKYRQPKVMLELGTSFGISALYQSLGAPSSLLYTMEGCPATAAIARQQFARFPQCNIQVIEGPFDETLQSLLSTIPAIDYVYIDGHHRLEPTLRYVDMIYPKLSADAVMVIDDINWSDEMREAWSRLIADQRFTQSMDVFMMGLLFNNKDLSKENFVVRY